MNSILQELSKKHDKKQFDCGHSAINTFLQQQAGQAGRKNLSRTSVLTRDSDPNRIMGFVTVLPVSIDAPECIVKSHQKVPALKIARLGVDKEFQEKGLGGVIIMEILKLFAQSIQGIPMVGICVDAKDESVGFYQKLGWEQPDTTRPVFWLGADRIIEIVDEYLRDS